MAPECYYCYVSILDLVVMTGEPADIIIFMCTLTTGHVSYPAQVLFWRHPCLLSTEGIWIVLMQDILFKIMPEIKAIATKGFQQKWNAFRCVNMYLLFNVNRGGVTCVFRSIGIQGILCMSGFPAEPRMTCNWKNIWTTTIDWLLWHNHCLQRNLNIVEKTVASSI